PHFARLLCCERPGLALSSLGVANIREVAVAIRLYCRALAKIGQKTARLASGHQHRRRPIVLCCAAPTDGFSVECINVHSQLTSPFPFTFATHLAANTCQAEANVLRTCHEAAT
ncbi:unnamed protein product, partial [Ectocarpus sp. 12 AP-2014]